ncbi:ChaN family lipoprotein [Engelhardtia mirabilis]|uniref:Haem-binding uptake Tiki superfamily ChaN domain-containing protein n=1 Tax=Engelhardtia mirabilis TaxID=2528011 RepID=A0A518BES7_9BACT|nr:hypothetical protein Pla133_05530 [Planctomycetes bacterium Pla133]QDU99814.1 hypothetical protein Pla86_05530 [Planctomycetes bacterium Pla86]
MHSINPATSPLIFLALALAGCASTTGSNAPGGADMAASVVPVEEARAFAVFDGDTGAELSFEELLERAAGVQVVVLGETHDDAGGHAYQRAVVEALFERFPGSALALEMLERDEQDAVNDLAAGLVDAAMFAGDTNSSSWAGEGSWAAWYQPVIDAALEHDGRVIAANAPRRYVRVASRRGYGPLAAVDARRRAYFDFPHGPQPEGYRQRFFELMGGMGHGDGGMDEEMVAKVFRSQSMWDATMAGSIAAAGPSTKHKVALLVGQFHSDFEGGTVAQLRHLLPTVRVLVISLQPVAAGALAEDDRGRADLVVYTR